MQVSQKVLDERRYAELFPQSSYATDSFSIVFGEHAQIWLKGREIVSGTRKNYRVSLNLYWMPALAAILTFSHPAGTLSSYSRQA